MARRYSSRRSGTRGRYSERHIALMVVGAIVIILLIVYVSHH
jgi:hypothetical protein